MLAWGLALLLGGRIHGDELKVLLDRGPHDRITLKAAAGGNSVDVLPLSVPRTALRQAHAPDEKLRVQIRKYPDDAFDVKWEHIEKVETYDELLAAAVRRKVREGQYDAAFADILDLHSRDLATAELDGIYLDLLFRESARDVKAGRYLEAIAVLDQYARTAPENADLARLTQGVVQSIVDRELKQQAYPLVWSVLEWVQARRSDVISPQKLAEWEMRIRSLAQEHLQNAADSSAKNDLTGAIREAKLARAADPDSASARQLLEEILSRERIFQVGVTRAAPSSGQYLPLEWSSVRAQRLEDRCVLEQVGIGSEGGVYQHPFGKYELSGQGQQLTIELDPRLERYLTASDPVAVAPPQGGIDSFQLVASILRSQEAIGTGCFPGIVGVRSTGPFRVDLRWRQGFLRPERLLTIFPIRGEGRADRVASPFQVEETPPGLSGVHNSSAKSLPEALTQDVLYTANPQYSLGGPNGPRRIFERVFPSTAELYQAILHGEIDVVDRLDAFHSLQLESQPGWRRDAYLAPTIHVLIPNMRQPQASNRAFRRGLVYAIDREQILRVTLFGGKVRGGCEILSAPIPKGMNADDPLSYAYDHQIKPLEFDPNLGLALCQIGLSQITAARVAAEEKAPGEVGKDKSADKQVTVAGTNDISESEKPRNPESTQDNAKTKAARFQEVETIRIVHAADPMSRVACESVANSWKRIGIPVTLHELPSRSTYPTDNDWDFWYCDLLITEPLWDLQVLLSPGPYLAETSSYVAMALRRVQDSTTWELARQALHDLHQVVHDEVTVLPLWQIREEYAFRQNVAGLTNKRLSLYQDVEAWQFSRADQSQARNATQATRLDRQRETLP